MRMSHLFGRRFKERPASAVLESHALLLRGGYLRAAGPGRYALLPAGMRVHRKLETGIRRAFEAAGGQELGLPGNRASETSPPPARDMRFLALCRNEIATYSQLPGVFFTFAPAAIEEPRSGGGPMYAAEPVEARLWWLEHGGPEANDGLSKLRDVVTRIFVTLGLPEPQFAEAPGEGAETALAVMVPAPSGDTQVALSDSGAYCALAECAACRLQGWTETPRDLEKVHTPGLKTIEDVAEYVGVTPRQGGKAVFYDRDAEGRLVLAMVRGDREVSEAKLAQLIGVAPAPASEARIQAAGTHPGFASPIGLDPGQVRLLIDHSIANTPNLTVGANEADYHYNNFNLARDLLPAVETVDIVQAREGDPAPGGAPLRFETAFEAGRIWQASTGPTEAAAVHYDDERGNACAPGLTTLSLNLSSLTASLVEVSHDAFGPVWPPALAPWDVHLCALAKGDGPVFDAAETLYAQLTEGHIGVLYDDRGARPGVQFAEADLLGIPLRLILGGRSLERGEVEWKRRATGEKGALPLGGVVEAVRRMLAEAGGTGE